MSIELQPSKNYPGRTALHHKMHPESNSTTIIDLTPEDMASLLSQLRQQERYEEHKRLAERSSIPDRDGADSAAQYARERREERPEWHGDREYLQLQHERSWTPERYGGTKG